MKTNTYISKNARGIHPCAFFHFIEKQAYAIRTDAEVDYKDPFESK